MSIFDLTTNLTSLSRQMTKVDRMAAKVGTAVDSQSFRDQLNAEEKQLNAIVKSTMESVKKTSQQGLLRSSEGQKLLGQFQGEYDKYQKLVKTLEAKQTIVLANAAKSFGGESTPLGASLREEANQAMRTGVQLDDIQFIEYDIQEVERRHQQIKELEGDVMEVAQMFQDLQTLVNQQQETIDIIDNNIRDGKEQVQAGHNQLEQASDYLSAIRRRKCFILLVVLVILAIVIGVAVGVSAN